MDYSLIELQVVDRVATLTLNRPDKRNAFDGPTIAAEIEGEETCSFSAASAMEPVSPTATKYSN